VPPKNRQTFGMRNDQYPSIHLPQIRDDPLRHRHMQFFYCGPILPERRGFTRRTFRRDDRGRTGEAAKSRSLVET
jgi:hypothetical protein